jgi:hypothetical protein
MTDRVRKHLIAAGISNLQEFGYDRVTTENILTDEVYSRFFLSMLRDNLGNGFDTEISALIAEIEKLHPTGHPQGETP